MGLVEWKSSIPAAFLFGLIFLAPSASLADDTEADKAKLVQCQKDICSILLNKQKDGADLSCVLKKTWNGEEIEKGAKEKHLTWGLGKTECNATVNVKRGPLVEAMSSPEYTLKIEKQPISCIIESGSEKYPVKLTMAPELKLKGGKVTNASLHMDDIEGAKLIKGVVWTAATLEQNLGLLEGDIVREVNRFIEKECPKALK
jgi:hypothetical protein